MAASAGLKDLLLGSSTIQQIFLPLRALCKSRTNKTQTPSTSTTSELTSPTEVQLTQITDLLIEVFDKDPMSNATTGGVTELKNLLSRILVRAAALEGRLFASEQVTEGTNESKIVSAAITFGPGVDFLGSDAQRALGAAEFMSKLPDETKIWVHGVNLPLSKQLIESTIGQAGVTDNWWIGSIATLESERGKGHASAILNKIKGKAEKEGKKVGLNAVTEQNVAFYKANGFTLLGSQERPSPFGACYNNIMVWEAAAAT